MVVKILNFPFVKRKLSGLDDSRNKIKEWKKLLNDKSLRISYENFKPLKKLSFYYKKLFGGYEIKEMVTSMTVVIKAKT